ncbi:sigma-70 family RNA polymerase sigma factor [Nonomuraea soli]|uniref:RNA polymerase sigma factor n=1 Tax=Nonomuraea soli TaxID=1032476 RepID=A0A7W0CN61_9ACTN|nr:sigma-70 family RNA polymerase sigma factor [Nonomuraea soli]MBA2894180.1 RNA polymerase sigma-70 factor (ECF subfamily) [Nonomuraea soli]
MTDNDEFLRQADPLRRELIAHCYRMMGSVHDAEDLVQETYLRAWNAYDKFDGRASMRTWLYKIATNTCLTALDSRKRRPMPTGLGQPSADPVQELVSDNEVPWLEPIPDVMVGADSMGADPAHVVTSRSSIRLALMAALQHLPARQRAVLVLREVLQWKAAEVAEVLGTTTTAVNSMLQRAKAQLEQAGLDEDHLSEPTADERKEILDRYVRAFEDYDMAAIVELFTKDAVWEMPPFVCWYQGPENIAELIANWCPAKRAGDLQLVAAQANGQAAFGMYYKGEPFAIPVLTLEGGKVKHVSQFFDLSLFKVFGLPDSV